MEWDHLGGDTDILGSSFFEMQGFKGLICISSCSNSIGEGYVLCSWGKLYVWEGTAP